MCHSLRRQQYSIVTSSTLFPQELARVVGAFNTNWGLGNGQTSKPVLDTKWSENPLKFWSLCTRKNAINSQILLVEIYLSGPKWH